MPVIIKGTTYYRTSEACHIAGIGRSTLLRWLRKDLLNDASYRDKRGWRLFTEDDVGRIEKEANHIA
jgi:DNA-binding transcriptional MerR regulator